jgi:iron complex outermembrane receptor protein
MKSRLRTAMALCPSLFLASYVTGAAEAVTDERVERIVVIGSASDADPAQREVALTPGAVSLVDIDAFGERNVSSLADVLQYVPGVWAASDSGSDAMFFSSRGSNLDATDYDMNGIKLLQDGLPVTTADGNNHNRVVDPLSAQHVTFARGANAMKYGASTLGGAADFATVTARDADRLLLSLDAGRFGQRLARLTVSTAAGERLDALLTAESKEWDGYRGHNAQQRRGLYGNVGWQLPGDVTTRFYGSWLENDQELPGPLTRAEAASDPGRANAAAVHGNYQLDVTTWRLANRTSWRLDDDGQFELGASFERQSLFHPIVDQVLVDFDGNGPAPPVEVFSLLIDTVQQNAGTMLRYGRRFGAHDLLLGVNWGATSVEGGHYRNLRGMPNGLTTRVDNDASSLELFAVDRWSVGDRLLLIAGAQGVVASRTVRNLDVASGSLRQPDADYSSLNPRVGLVYEPGEAVAVYANLSRLYEPPTNYELEDNVAGGEATLDAMHGTVVEIGTRGQRRLGAFSNWAWDVSLYHARVEDEILSVDDPAAPGTSLSTNVDRTLHAGLEAFVQARLALDAADGRYLEPLLGFTVNRFAFDDDPVYGNNRLPAAPRYVARGEIVYRDANGWYAGPTFEFVGARHADFANRYRIEGYALVGLRGGWSGERWSVYAEIRNLLDEDYVASHDVRDIAAEDAAILNPGTPRAAYAGVRWRLP